MTTFKLPAMTHIVFKQWDEDTFKGWDGGDVAVLEYMEFGLEDAARALINDAHCAASFRVFRIEMCAETNLPETVTDVTAEAIERAREICGDAAPRMMKWLGDPEPCGYCRRESCICDDAYEDRIAEELSK